MKTTIYLSTGRGVSVITGSDRDWHGEVRLKDQHVQCVAADVNGKGIVYCGTLGSEANKRFVEAYRRLYKATPGPYPYLAYMAAKAAIQALKDVNGRAEDHDAVAAALRKVQLDGPMGKVFFDERQGMVADAYTLKVVRKDGTLQNECIERIPESRDPYNLFP